MPRAKANPVNHLTQENRRTLNTIAKKHYPLLADDVFSPFTEYRNVQIGYELVVVAMTPNQLHPILTDPEFTKDFYVASIDHNHSLTFLRIFAKPRIKVTSDFRFKDVVKRNQPVMDSLVTYAHKVNND
jgi:hypothetical protein